MDTVIRVARIVIAALVLLLGFVNCVDELYDLTCYRLGSLTQGHIAGNVILDTAELVCGTVGALLPFGLLARIAMAAFALLAGWRLVFSFRYLHNSKAGKSSARPKKKKRPKRSRSR